ncbi:hypothetical protein KSF81_25155 [Siccirubricoccus sp. G192]|nr:hypothetical protein [Siccirubricoccus sp. G192]MBV1800071.1 hypothetical protein [Siccirubricoccus sp. G192]
MALKMFDVIATSDCNMLDGTTRIVERVARPRTSYAYQVQDRALWRTNFDRPIFTLATRSAGSVIAGHAESRFATEVTMDGEESGLFCFTILRHGRIALRNGRDETIAMPGCGLAFRPGADVRLLTSDGNARTNVFIDAAEVEAALERLLDQHLPQPLKFRPGLDWSGGLASSLKRQLEFLMLEFQRPDGIADNALALASMTDLLIALMLAGATHNYTGEIERRGTQRSRGTAVPAYVRRAEAFMAAHCQEPIPEFPRSLLLQGAAPGPSARRSRSFAARPLCRGCMKFGWNRPGARWQPGAMLPRWPRWRATAASPTPVASRPPTNSCSDKRPRRRFRTSRLEPEPNVVDPPTVMPAEFICHVSAPRGWRQMSSGPSCLRS